MHNGIFLICCCSHFLIRYPVQLVNNLSRFVVQVVFEKPTLYIAYTLVSLYINEDGTVLLGYEAGTARQIGAG